jgi:hypothetical protein
VKALLRGWRREISDRYLDLQDLIRLARRTFRSEREAFAAIRPNAPVGAVRFVMNELERVERPFALFGQRVSPRVTYNDYYTALLGWDEDHLIGLIAHINHLNASASIGGAIGLHPVWHAALNWLVANQANGVYAAAGVSLAETMVSWGLAPPARR